MSRRRAWRIGLTVLAVVVLLAMSLLPRVIDTRMPAALLRLPAEPLVAVAVLALVPWRVVRRILAVLFGLLLAVALVLAGIDLGFEYALDAHFDPTDLPRLNDGFGVLQSSIGTGPATGVLIGLIVLAIAAVALAAWAALRVASAVRSRRRIGGTVLAGVTAVLLIVGVSGAQIVPGQPVAASAAVTSITSTIGRASAARQAVAQLPHEVAADPYAQLPSSSLLTALRGKDVVLAFVESYGQVAVQGTSFSGGVDQVLRSGQSQLAADGYSEQSAFLTSPTFGGLSWLAHSTLESGLWVNEQPLYSQLIRSKRLTLSDAFKDAGWKTVSDVPSDAQPWPFGSSFYHFDTLLTSSNVGYRGPSFGYARIPDEYTWKYFADHELSGPHQPVMAEIDLVSSHTPWAPLPKIVPWSQLGDGSIFGPQPAQGDSAEEVWQHAASVQQAYGQSVQYSLQSMFTFLENVNDPNLVVIELGDHQPATIVSGQGANHEVPISIIAKDPSVFRAIAGWHWQSGLLPTSQAPLWRMDQFRNRFLTAFDVPAPASH